MKKLLGKALICITFFLLCACKKSEFLEETPSKSLIIPKTLGDFQAILDNTGYMNGLGNGIVPTLGEAASDDYYVIPDGFSAAAAHPTYKKLYTWQDDYDGLQFEDWGYAYRTVFYSNVVLSGLNDYVPSLPTLNEYNNIKGSALFYRANVFYQLAQIYCMPYDQNTSDSELGIVLKLNSDINEKITRATVKRSYEQIINDLEESVQLLPNLPRGDIRTRPSKAAALALLARTYLSMRAYDSALVHADACLNIYDSLLDYNDNNWVNTGGTLGLRQMFNPEIIFPCSLVSTTINSLMFSNVRARVDSVLYQSYDNNDLRKSVFYRPRTGAYIFKGSYDANSTLFGGLATDEIFLIRAECYARKGDLQNALLDLNALLSKRWSNSVVFIPLTAADVEEALEIILMERRKELVYRGLRWMDLRRLNKEGRNIVPRRMVDGITYSLLPNTYQYAFLIPSDVMSFNPQMKQNKR